MPTMQGRKSETAQQIAFADKIIINKIDLVSDEEAAVVNAAIATMNPRAECRRVVNADVDMRWVLERRGDPEVLEQMVEQLGKDESSCAIVPQGEAAATMGLGPRNVLNMAGGYVKPAVWHGANGGVGSVFLSSVGRVHLGRFNRWVRDVLSERGDDLYRYKGLLAVAGYEERYIFQGVHMLFTGTRGRKWFNGEEPVCKLVMIGRRLDRAGLEAGFRSTLM